MFKIGDRVRAIKEHDTKMPTGIGDIFEINSHGTLLIRWSEWNDGHGPANNEWYYSINSYDKLELVIKTLTLNEDRVIDLCREFSNANRKIAAIKLWREFSGAGLKEAKEFIEADCRQPLKVGQFVVHVESGRKIGTIIAIHGIQVWVKDSSDGHYSTYDLPALKAE